MHLLDQTGDTVPQEDVAGSQNVKTETGIGGETHQSAGNEVIPLTTQQGVVVSDDQNTLRAGEAVPELTHPNG